MTVSGYTSSEPVQRRTRHYILKGTSAEDARTSVAERLKIEFAYEDLENDAFEAMCRRDADRGRRTGLARCCEAYRSLQVMEVDEWARADVSRCVFVRPPPPPPPLSCAGAANSTMTAPVTTLATAAAVTTVTPADWVDAKGPAACVDTEGHAARMKTKGSADGTSLSTRDESSAAVASDPDGVDTCYRVIVIAYVPFAAEDVCCATSTEASEEEYAFELPVPEHYLCPAPSKAAARDRVLGALLAGTPQDRYEHLAEERARPYAEPAADVTCTDAEDDADEEDWSTPVKVLTPEEWRLADIRRCTFVRWGEIKA